MPADEVVQGGGRQQKEVKKQNKARREKGVCLRQQMRELKRDGEQKNDNLRETLVYSHLMVANGPQNYLQLLICRIFEKLEKMMVKTKNTDP